MLIQIDDFTMQLGDTRSIVLLERILKIKPYLEANSENIMLAEISFETEFKIQEITALLFRIQELRRLKLVTSGFSFDPSLNPNLFLTKRAMVMARIQEA